MSIISKYADSPVQGVDEVDFYLQTLKMRYSKIDPKEYYLSYSGGRDSHLLYWFQKVYMKGTSIEDIPIVGINTYMEHPEILRRILDNSDIVLKPTMKPFDIKEKYGTPCFSKSQDYFIESYQKGSKAESHLKRFYGIDKSWHNVSKKAREYILSDKAHKVSPKCCKYLKKEPCRNYEKESGNKPILGIRKEESKMRASQYGSCLTKKGIFTPIYDLSTDLLDKIIDKYSIEVPDIYNYVSRTGCMGCPYGSYKKECQENLKHLKGNQLKFVREYFKESYIALGIDVDAITGNTND